MIVFENVFGILGNKDCDDIKAMWLTERALEDEKQMDARLRQVVYVVRDTETGNVAGVSTSEKKMVSALNNNFLYEFRCFISEAYRIAGLDVKLSKMTIDFLESISKQDADKPIGVFAILENEALKKETVWRRAVWPEIEMYFVGYTNTGNPIRVHYFKGAKI